MPLPLTLCLFNSVCSGHLTRLTSDRSINALLYTAAFVRSLTESTNTLTTSVCILFPGPHQGTESLLCPLRPYWWNLKVSRFSTDINSGLSEQWRGETRHKAENKWVLYVRHGPWSQDKGEQSTEKCTRMAVISPSANGNQKMCTDVWKLEAIHISF